MTDVKPEYYGTRDMQQPTAYFTMRSNGKTLLENKFAGIRNVILIGAADDAAMHIPVFEAVWNRVNVYRNPNLDPRVDEFSDISYFYRYVDRMDEPLVFARAAPLKLKTPLALDKHLHYVPIGNIDGVLPVLPKADGEDTVFRPDGVPLPHKYAVGTKPRASLGAFADTQQFDAQIRLSLEDEYIDDVLLEHDVNSHRSALVQLPSAKVREFGDHTRACHRATWSMR